MTGAETQWLASDDPQEMLRAIDPTLTRVWKKGYPEPWRVWSNRKARLFACTCLRSLPDEIKGGPECLPLRACAAAERYADGSPKDADYSEGEKYQEYVCHPSAKTAAERFIETCDDYRKPLLANLLRDIFGNPWRPIALPTVIVTTGVPITIHDIECNGAVFNCPWFTWHDGLIPRMAQDIYDSRRFEELPVLADALEEAGCVVNTICPECNGSEQDNTGEKWCKACSGTGRINELLVHLRAPCPYCKDAPFDTGDSGIPIGAGIKDQELSTRVKRVIGEYHNERCLCKGTRRAIHVKGCWVLDLLLGKE